MPAEAGIQSVGEGNNFKDLDSRLRGNDCVFPLATQSPMGEGRVGVKSFRNLVLLSIPLTPALSRKSIRPDHGGRGSFWLGNVNWC
jgi:hypothetical protein